MGSTRFKRQVSVIFLLAIFSVVSIILHLTIPLKESHSDREFHLLITECIHDDIISMIRGPIQVSKAMAQNSFALDLLEHEDEYSEEYLIQKFKAWLSNIRQTGEYTSCFLVSDKTRRYYTGDGLLKIINPHVDSHDIWYSNILAKNVPYALDVDLDQANGNKWTVFIDLRVENAKGELLGVCGIGVVVDELQELFKTYEEKYEIKVNLVDKNGLVQVDTHSISIENAYHRLQNPSFTEKYDYAVKGDGFVATTFIPELDWYLVVSNVLNSHVQKSKSPVFIITIILLFILLSVIICLQIHADDKNKLANPVKNEPVDPLTGLFNRNYFKDVYGERGVFNTTRYKSIAVFDIDFFKEANDNIDGDAVLLHVTEVARRIFEHDEIFRWGGDEFTVLITQNLTQAYDLCYAFASELEKEGLVTVSVGVTDVRLSDMIKKNYYRAAQACYLVKEMGGNGVKRT